jgi:hypothetical protein
LITSAFRVAPGVVVSLYLLSMTNACVRLLASDPLEGVGGGPIKQLTSLATIGRMISAVRPYESVFATVYRTEHVFYAAAHHNG